MSNETSVRCNAEGPGGLECTRDGEHVKHVTYQKVGGQLQHVAWFSCDVTGEPIDE